MRLKPSGLSILDEFQDRNGKGELGDISLGDIVFSDGDLNYLLGQIFVMLKNRISPFDIGCTVLTISQTISQTYFYITI